MYAMIKDRFDLGSKFKKLIAARDGLDNYGGMSSMSAEGTTHTVRKEEQVAFSNWINRWPICIMSDREPSDNCPIE